MNFTIKPIIALIISDYAPSCPDLLCPCPAPSRPLSSDNAVAARYGIKRCHALAGSALYCEHTAAFVIAPFLPLLIENFSERKLLFLIFTRSFSY
jgi:hypothetical protein